MATATIAPTNASSAPTRSASWKPRRYASCGLRPDWSAVVVPAATIAPITAIPSDPPTWRIELRTADPTPALSTGTEPIAAAVTGVIVEPMPMPPMISPGRIAQKLASAPSRE